MWWVRCVGVLGEGCLCDSSNDVYVPAVHRTGAASSSQCDAQAKE